MESKFKKSSVKVGKTNPYRINIDVGSKLQLGSSSTSQKLVVRRTIQYCAFACDAVANGCVTDKKRFGAPSLENYSHSCALETIL